MTEHNFAARAEALLHLHAEKEGFALLSGAWELGGSEALQYFFLDPLLRIDILRNGSKVASAKSLVFESADPFGAFREFLFPMLRESSAACPFVCGRLHYEALHLFECVPESSPISDGISLARFYLYDKVLEVRGEKSLQHRLPLKLGYESFWTSPTQALLTPADHAQPKQISAAEYQSGVRAIKELIRLGEVYQVNLTRAFDAQTKLSAGEIFLRVCQRSAPALGAVLHDSAHGSTICASPELFVECDGKTLLSSPIKGTAPRGVDAAADRESALELQRSEKNRAELAMIVDLIRNDLGRVAELGSVHVRSHARLDTLPYVHHLVSDIAARLGAKRDLIDVLRALFPCGSITGAPKIAAMKYIAALEKQPRGAYCGAIGWIASPRVFKFNVAIRCANLKEGYLTYRSGAGIVWDSDAEEEERETLEKTRIFGGLGTS